MAPNPERFSIMFTIIVLLTLQTIEDVEDSYSHESDQDDEDDVDYDGVTMYEGDCLDDYNDDDYEEVRIMLKYVGSYADL